MIYKCKICPFFTNVQGRYIAHINKKGICRPNVLHRGVKLDKSHICEKCNISYSTSSNLNRHIKKYHPKGTVIKKGNNKINNNGNNNTNKIDNSINVTNIINNYFNIHDFDYYNAKDLKLFEQYRFLIAIPTPHIVLLDTFNLNPNEPKYHNIHYSNYKSSSINFVKDNKWDTGEAMNIFNKMIISGTELFRIVYNRFRIFFSNNARNYIPGFYFKGFCINNNKIAACIRKHLYKNKLKTQKNIVRTEKHIDNEDIPNDRNDRFFWALHMNFFWDEIKQFFIISDEIEINFNADLNSIKDELIEKNLNFQSCEKLYNKVIKHIDHIISTADRFSDEIAIEKQKYNETIFKNPFNHSDSDIDDSIVYHIHKKKFRHKKKFSNSDDESCSESESERDENKSKIDSYSSYSESEHDEKKSKIDSDSSSEHDIDELIKRDKKESKSKFNPKSGSKSVHKSKSASAHKSGSKSAHKSGSKSAHKSGSKSVHKSGSKSAHKSGSKSKSKSQSKTELDSEYIDSDSDN